MNDEQLQTLTEEISQSEFHRPFKHQAYFNRRLRTTGGRYLLKRHNIEVNDKQYEKYGYQAVVDIIKHELCHYHLHLTGRGYQHRDTDFKQLSLHVGAPRYCTPIQSYEERVNYMYERGHCHTKFPRIRKVDTKKMRCGRCGGRLKLVQNYKIK